MAKEQKIKDKSSETSMKDNAKMSLNTEEAVNAKVLEILGRTGARGEVTQVNALIMGGKNDGKEMRRNIKGPVKIGDLLTVRETEIEARRIRTNTQRRTV